MDEGLGRHGAEDDRPLAPTVRLIGCRPTRPELIVGHVSAAGDTVYSYGNSSLRAGAAPLSPKSGASLGDQAHGWTRSVYTATPGVPGDSGSGYLDGSGRAVGVLSTVEFAPLAASNGVGDLARELAFARRHSGIAGLRLVPGTKGFDPMP